MGTADRAGQAPSNELLLRIDNALGEIRAELARSMTKHAAMHSPHEGMSVINEEVDELWDLVKTDMARTVEGRKEAMQVAAMGLRFALDVCGDDPPTMQVQHARTFVPAPS